MAGIVMRPSSSHHLFKPHHLILFTYIAIVLNMLMLSTIPAHPYHYFSPSAVIMFLGRTPIGNYHLCKLFLTVDKIISNTIVDWGALLRRGTLNFFWTGVNLWANYINGIIGLSAIEAFFSCLPNTLKASVAEARRYTTWFAHKFVPDQNYFSSISNWFLTISL